MLKQPLFGNRYISCKRKNKTVIPYYVNLINSSICYVKDLKFENGTLDTKHLYDIIKPKRNIHNEVAIMMKCLKPLIKGISNNPHENRDELEEKQSSPKLQKAKYFYSKLVSYVKETPQQHNIWKTKVNIETDIDSKTMFCCKIIDIKDNKLAETNYKILYKILPCGVNLKKWKKKESDQCHICNESETIQHLLYECQYATYIWNKVEESLNIKITLKDIIVGKTSRPELNMLTSLIVYLIYKDWINHSMNNNQRPKTPNIKKYTLELTHYKQIYNASKTLMKYVQYIENIIQAFSL